MLIVHLSPLIYISTFNIYPENVVLRVCAAMRSSLVSSGGPQVVTSSVIIGLR